MRVASCRGKTTHEETKKRSGGALSLKFEWRGSSGEGMARHICSAQSIRRDWGQIRRLKRTEVTNLKGGDL